MKKALVTITLGSLLFVGSVSSVFAGEITGNGQVTPIKSRGVAASECAFSGLEDSPHSPGTTQTPAGTRGVPGNACNPTGGPDRG